MIVGGVVLLFVGVQAHDSVAPSVTNLWALEGGFFANGFTGFLACFTVVMFAFGGIENIGIAAGEAKDPRTSIPKAIRTVPFRILIFYILTPVGHHVPVPLVLGDEGELAVRADL